MRFASIPKFTLGAAALVLSSLAGTLLGAQKFRPDDPMRVDADNLIDAGEPAEHPLSRYYDFILHSFSDPADPDPGRAVNINTLGEVPGSSWFENRHGRRRMAVDELVRGPDETGGPASEGVWTVIAAKTEGLTPGFRIRDARGDVYVIKFDPPGNPEMATAAEVISTKFFYAMGYHVPENYIVYLDRERLRIDPGATLEDEDGERSMQEKDLDDILARTHRSSEGTHRAVASLFLAGRPLGPFQYFGTRPDDPNDIFPHENRRELRGLRVLASWLNHDDARAVNTQDMVVEEDGARFVRHHLIDFGSTLGSGSIGPQTHRAGWEYMWEPKATLARVLTLGLWDRKWIRVGYPDSPSIGRFESSHFEPEGWRPEQPNPAFLRATSEDAYWAAKIVMAFTDEEVRAIVKTGQLSDPRAEAYLAGTLIERRDKIGRYWFGLVNTADDFELTPGGRLRFERLASVYEFDEWPEDTGLTWSRFDNRSGAANALGPERPYAPEPVSLPEEIGRSASGSYFRARFREGGRFVDVYLRNEDGTLAIVGIERETG